MATEALYWDQMNWREIAALTTSMRAAILPIGAVEQHGPHLPLSTDWEIVEAVAGRISARTGVPVAPSIRCGTSASQGGWPGTINLRPHTLALVVQDIAQSLYEAGVRQFLLLNGHGWNRGAILSAQEWLRCAYPDVQTRVANWYDHVLDEPELDPDCPHDRKMAHGNYTETSCMLYVRPDLVRMELAVDEPDAALFWEYRMDQISRQGTIGRNTTGANEATGRLIIEAASDRLADRLARALHEQAPYATTWTRTTP